MAWLSLPSLKTNKLIVFIFDRSFRQRIIALFLLSVLFSSISTPSAFAVANEIDPLGVNRNAQTPPSDFTEPKIPASIPRTSTRPSIGKIPDSSKYPTGMKAKTSKNVAAADARPLADNLLNSMSRHQVPRGEIQQSLNPNNKVEPRELVERRTSNTTESLNDDGSITKKQFLTPKFYKKDNKWLDIDTHLIEDKNSDDSGNILGQMAGQVQSWISPAKDYIVRDNDWQARFSSSINKKGMVRIKKGDSQIGFIPVGAKDVAPVITTDDQGRQTVNYYDIWPGINVEYRVGSDNLKENIIIKNKSATNNVSYEVIGAKLQNGKHKTANGEPLSAIDISGALNDEFSIAPANMILNNFGLVTEKDVFSQSFKDNIVTVSVGGDYLNQLPDNAFPVVIDPTTFHSSFGTRAGGNYVSFKTDGYNCVSTVCNPYAGSLYDTNNNLQYWRSAFYAPYDQFRNSSNLLTNATLHLSQRNNAGFWTGYYDTHNFQVGHAGCLTGFNCRAGNWFAAANIAMVGDRHHYFLPGAY